MPPDRKHRKLLKIFLASPGDLQDERKIARRIVVEENTNHANVLGYHIELVGWEETVAQFRRAQEVINRDLDQCDFFVGLMWKRWGTPPGPVGHPYTSGFEEEYTRSVERHHRTGAPEIALLFKQVSADQLADQGPELKRVQSFKEKIKNEKTALFQEFGDLTEFDQRFRTIASFFLHQEYASDLLKINKADEPVALSYSEAQSLDQAPTDGIFDESVRVLVNNEILARPKIDELAPSAAARFRLLGHTIIRAGNDDSSLGVHDANLIFRDFRQRALSEREVRGLINAALEKLTSEIAPLWHWLSETRSSPSMELALRTLYGGDRVQANAFRALSLLGLCLKDLTHTLKREAFLSVWFSVDSPDQVKIAALSFLATSGSDDNLSAIEPSLDSAAANVAAAAVRAKAQILLKRSSADALRFISEWEDVDIGNALAEKLMRNPLAIPTDAPKLCLENKSRRLQQLVTEELQRRNALTQEDARQLCASDNADARLSGVLALRETTGALAFADARDTILRTRSSLLSPFFGLLAPPPDRAASDAFGIFKKEVLLEKSFDELLHLRNSAGPSDIEEILTFYEKFFQKKRDKIHCHLRNKFCDFFSENKKNDNGDSVITDDKKIASARKQLCEGMIQIVCRYGDLRELSLVRWAIDEKDIGYHAAMMNFLGRYGEWQDVRRIISVADSQKPSGLSLLSIVDTDREDAAAAQAILKIGADRIADVLCADPPSGIKKNLHSYDQEGFLRIR